MRLAALVCIASMLPAASAAEPATDAVARARAHFEVGSGLYKLGNYEDAIREFSAGYALTHRPQFPLNIGQCYRRLGRFEEARAMVRRFLDEAPADAPERPSATALLGEIERELARGPAAPAVVVAPPAQVERAATPPARSRRGLWIGLGVGGALLIGGAITAGVLLSRQEIQPPTSLGAVPFGR